MIVNVSVVSDNSDTVIKGILMTSNEGRFPDTDVYAHHVDHDIITIEHENCRKVSRCGLAAANQ